MPSTKRKEESMIYYACCSFKRVLLTAGFILLFLAKPGWAQFDSDKIALLSHIDLRTFGANSGNDSWGYVSSSGREYALMGLSNKMAVVEITNPENPVIVGTVSHSSSLWADIKVYRNVAYVSNESGGGIDIVDLSDVDNGTVRLVKRLTTNGLQTSHNLAINTDSGFLYLGIGNINGGAMVAYDLSDPENPVEAGRYRGSRSHDIQVVTYDSGQYAGREIAFSFSEGRGLDVIDVTDKSDMFLMSRTTYPCLSYCHQGWLSEDKHYLYVDDELDESNCGFTTRTLVFDVSSDLENPTLVNTFTSGRPSIDHNQYVRDGFIYQANYTSGLRVFNGNDDPTNPTVAGFFDTYPEGDSVGFDGAWNVFPFFPSGIVIVSDLDRGLFILDVSEAVGDQNQPGACCLPEGGCEDLIRQDCIDRGGAFKFGTDCGNVNCSKTGACCIDDATCAKLTEQACNNAGGTFLGEGASCRRACPCDQIKKFKARCSNNGTIKSVVKFRDNSHSGETVTIAVGEDEFIVRIFKKKAKLNTCCDTGPTTVELRDPSGCFDPIVADCPS